VVGPAELADGLCSTLVKSARIVASASGFDPMVNAEKNRLMKIVQTAVMA